MSRKYKSRQVVVIVLLAGAAGAVWGLRFVSNRTTTLRGAVITANTDPRKQFPVGGVEITASRRNFRSQNVIRFFGIFTVALRKRIFRNHP